MEIKSKPGIYITGIGLPLRPNSSLDIKIFAWGCYYGLHEKLIHEERLNSSGNKDDDGNKDTDIVPINFQNPIKEDGYHRSSVGRFGTKKEEYTKITIQIKGRGELRFGCRKLTPPLQKDNLGWMTYSMNYSRKNGLGKNIEVSIRGEDEGILAELYIKPLYEN